MIKNAENIRRAVLPMLRLCICPKCGRKHPARARSCPCGYVFSDDDPVYFFDDDAFSDSVPAAPSPPLSRQGPALPASAVAPVKSPQRNPLRTCLIALGAFLALIFLISFLFDRAYESGRRDGISSGFSNGYTSGYYDGRDRDIFVSPSSQLKDTVYVTRTGEKYHRDGCQYLHSKIPTTRLDAIADGYSRCSRCDP